MGVTSDKFIWFRRICKISWFRIPRYAKVDFESRVPKNASAILMNNFQHNGNKDTVWLDSLNLQKLPRTGNHMQNNDFQHPTEAPNRCCPDSKLPDVCLNQWQGMKALSVKWCKVISNQPLVSIHPPIREKFERRTSHLFKVWWLL